MIRLALNFKVHLAAGMAVGALAVIAADRLHKRRAGGVGSPDSQAADGAHDPGD